MFVAIALIGINLLKIW